MAQRRPATKKTVTDINLPDEPVVDDVVEAAPQADTDGPAWLSTAPTEPAEPEEQPVPELPVINTKIQPHPDAAQYRVREGEPKGLILGPNDPVRLTGKDTGTEVIVDQDIFRKVYPRNTKRPTYILLYPKGMKVAKSTLQRVNI